MLLSSNHHHYVTCLLLNFVFFHVQYCHARAVALMPYLGLLDLPNELLSSIFEYLHSLDIECVALTFNKVLYGVCLPLLRHRIASAKHAKYILELFDKEAPGEDPSAPFDNGMYSRSGLAGKYGPYDAPPVVDKKNPINNLDFLDLRDDLYWLQALLDGSGSYIESDRDTRAITASLRALIECTSRLGLTLPKSFVLFMSSICLRLAMPFHTSYKAPSFCVGPLMKIRPRNSAVDEIDEVDSRNMRHGYVVKIFTDQDPFSNQIYTSYLYLDATGACCVLGGELFWGDRRRHVEDRHLIDLTPLEHQLGIIALPKYAVDECYIMGITFEDFLARIYFGNWAWVLLCLTAGYYAEDSEDDDFDDEDDKTVVADNEDLQPQIQTQKLPTRAKTFIINMYTARGRSSWRSRPLMRDLY
jgi:hypothetical protein